MSEMSPERDVNSEERMSHTRRIERERALFLFTCALDRGDFKTIAALYEQAETDPDLERMLLELNEVHLAEMEETNWEQAAGQVRALLAQHLPSAQIIDLA